MTSAQAWGGSRLTVRRGEHTVLHDISLPVPRSRVVAVVGGDGAGKTTLLRTLVGAIAPESGEVRRPAMRDTGFMPTSSGVWRELTVEENLRFVAGVYGVGSRAYTRRRGELLEAAGLTDVTGRLASQLSGGMRQKLAFCLAMLHAPTMLILDEPSTGVDPVSRVELWRLIAQAAAGGAAVVMSTSYLDEAERASAVLVLHEGRALLSGTPEQVVAMTPGTIVEAVTPADPQRAWRRGRAFHCWTPAGQPAGAGLPVVPDLEDTVIAATLDSAPPAPAPAAPVAAAAHRPGAGEPLIDVSAVSRSFGGTLAVDDLSLTVHGGEIVGLLGANGAGKTTVIRMILGLLAADTGTVRVFGAAPSRHSRRRLGYVPQGLGLWSDLTVAENLDFVADTFGAADSGLPSLASGAIEESLRAASDRLVADIDLGLQRQLAFAAALGHRPGLLVLDEPTSGVDPLGRARLWDVVHGCAEAGIGVLVTTHYMQEAQQCDRLVLMAHGRQVAAGAEHDIIAGTTAIAVDALDTDGGWAAAFTALDAQGLSVSLAGRRVRVADGDPRHVGDVLARAGIPAHLDVVPATLEETMALRDGAAARAR